MDEITLVRDLRSEVTEPDPETLARIRRRVLAGLPLASAGSTRANLILGRRPLLRLAVAGGLAAAVAAGTIAVDALVTRDGKPVVGHEAAAAELNRAAAAAIQASDPPLAPGQFYYLRMVEVAGTTIGGTGCGDLFYLHKNVYETWVPKDWNDQWMYRRTDDVGKEYLRPGDEAKVQKCAPQEPGSGPEVRKAPAGMFFPDGVDRTDQQPRDPSGAIVYNPTPAEIARYLADGNWQRPTPPFMAGLPRDPGRLLQRIYDDSAGHGRGKDDEAFVYIRDVLRSGVVPADLRAALFGAAALIPGVRLVSDPVNLDGRHGVAVAMSDTVSNHGDSRVELIFDSASGEVIGEREVTLTSGYIPGVPAGKTIESTSVIRQVVNAMGAEPQK
jgi:RNA polymerase sigma-70 factor (ECF subfamily)